MLRSLTLVFSILALAPAVTAATVTHRSSPYSITPFVSNVYCDASNGGVVINLPRATGSGMTYTIEKLDLRGGNAAAPTAAGTCEVIPAGKDLIDGLTGAFGDPVYYPLVNQFQRILLTDRAAGAWALLDEPSSDADSFTLANGFFLDSVPIPGGAGYVPLFGVGNWVATPGMYRVTADVDLDVEFGGTVPTAMNCQFWWNARQFTAAISQYNFDAKLFMPDTTMHFAFSVGSRGNDGGSGVIPVTTLTGPNLGTRIYCEATANDVIIDGSSHFVITYTRLSP